MYLEGVRIDSNSRQMRTGMHRGWYQVAFERELRGKLTPAVIGDLQLVLVRMDSGIKAFDAACPHRGAHLAYGGKLDGEVITCPFHGNRIGLSPSAPCSLKARGYRTLEAGGLVFVLLSDRHENGFTDFMAGLQPNHFFVQGFTLTANAPAELVVENGFDRCHFHSVHGLKSSPDLQLLPHEQGSLLIEATFRAGAFENAWHNNPEEQNGSRIGFLAHVFSPNLCVTRLGAGQDQYLVISGATPNGDGRCTIRVSVAVPAGPSGRPPSEQAVRALLRDSKLAYEQDMVIWEHRIHDAPSQLDPSDNLVLEYHRYCQRFLEPERL
jgi:3-ketosteroid 9alpha-monooxygenase subunit A